MDEETNDRRPGNDTPTWSPADPVPEHGRSGVDELQRVDVERMETGREQRRFESREIPGGIHVMYTSQASGAAGFLRPPVISTWICLLLAWFFLGSKVPFTVFIGIPLDVAALVLAAISLSRGGIFTGLLVMLLGTVGSLIVYLVGLFRFLAIGL